MDNTDNEIEISDYNTPKYLGIRKHGHRVLAVKCSYCNNFYTVREDVYNTGRKRSCGCLHRERTRKLGLSHKGKRKKNRFYAPPGKNYVKIFYDNFDGFFILSKEDYPRISQFYWRAWLNGDRIEPCTTIDKKTVLLSRMLMETPKELQCDHIDGCPQDAQRENLRNCTQLQNLFNRKGSEGVVFLDKKGKYRIKRLWGVDTKQLEFETEKEANATLTELRDKYQGEFSYPASQEIAKKIETFEFSEGKRFYCSPVLDKIEALPQKHILKLILNNIRRDVLSGRLSEYEEGQELSRLKSLAIEFSIDA